MKKNSIYTSAPGKEDVPLILEFVKGIASFEKLSSLVTATEETLLDVLFGEKTLC